MCILNLACVRDKLHHPKTLPDPRTNSSSSPPLKPDDVPGPGSLCRTPCWVLHTSLQLLLQTTSYISPLSTIAIFPTEDFALGLNLSHGAVAWVPTSCQLLSCSPSPCLPRVRQACCTSPAASRFIFVGLGKAVGVGFFFNISHEREEMKLRCRA